jgi:hypothetical protein
LARGPAFWTNIFQWLTTVFKLLFLISKKTVFVLAKVLPSRNLFAVRQTDTSVHGHCNTNACFYAIAHRGKQAEKKTFSLYSI